MNINFWELINQLSSAEIKNLCNYMIDYMKDGCVITPPPEENPELIKLTEIFTKNVGDSDSIILKIGAMETRTLSKIQNLLDLKDILLRVFFVTIMEAFKNDGITKLINYKCREFNGERSPGDVYRS